MKRVELIQDKNINPEWEGLRFGPWTEKINVENFIKLNLNPYYGTSEFLKGPSIKTQNLWSEVIELIKKEHQSKGGVLDTDTTTVSTIASHSAGYIDKELELIVGLQTDKPLKRGFVPFGGFRMAKQAAEAYGFKIDPNLEKSFQFRKTHNDGVFDVYTNEMKNARRAAIITGLPDSYGRGRIIGDYRRVALYGLDFLIENKKSEIESLENSQMLDEIIRLREELAEQIRALNEMAWFCS